MLDFYSNLMIYIVCLVRIVQDEVVLSIFIIIYLLFNIYLLVPLIDLNYNLLFSNFLNMFYADLFLIDFLLSFLLSLRGLTSMLCNLSPSSLNYWPTLRDIMHPLRFLSYLKILSLALGPIYSSIPATIDDE